MDIDQNKRTYDGNEDECCKKSRPHEKEFNTIKFSSEYIDAIDSGRKYGVMFTAKKDLDENGVEFASFYDIKENHWRTSMSGTNDEDEPKLTCFSHEEYIVLIKTMYNDLCDGGCLVAPIVSTCGNHEM